MRIRYENRRTLVTLAGTARLRLKIRRCEAAGCARHRAPYRPEAEAAWAPPPQHEFGSLFLSQARLVHDDRGWPKCMRLSLSTTSVVSLGMTSVTRGLFRA